jgi:hypothetical protein
MWFDSSKTARAAKFDKCSVLSTISKVDVSDVGITTHSYT